MLAWIAAAVRALALLASVAGLTACSLLLAEGEGEGEGEGEVVRIDAVDGTGALLPPSTSQPNATAAARRFVGDLVVRGAGLAAVESAALVRGADSFPLESVAMVTDERRTFRAPNELTAGLFTLVLTTAAGAAQAQVFLLQGEPGLNTLHVTVDADAAACPWGGVVEQSGLDVDRDGVLDADEVQLEAPRCDRAVVAPVARSVDNEAALQAALGELAGLGLAAPVTLILPPALTLTQTLVVSHPDGRYLELRGATGGTVITSALGESIRVLNGGATLSQMRLEASGAANVGVNIGFGAPAFLVDFAANGFDEAVRCSGNLVFNRASLAGNDMALRVQRSGSARHEGALTIVSTTTGVAVQQGGVLELSNTASVTAPTAVVVLDNGSVVVNGSALAGAATIRAASFSMTGGSLASLSVLEGGTAALRDVTATGEATMSCTRGATLRVQGGTAFEILVTHLSVASFFAPHTCRTAAGGVCLDGT